MRILVTGATGLLGYDLCKELLLTDNEIYGCSLREKNNILPENNFLNFDITDNKQTYEIISKINPDVVIHTSAYSDVDGCEKTPQIAYKINSIGTRNICIACQRFDTVMCYISTDYVFDGKNTPVDGYNEFDVPNPLSVYAKTKYYGELYVKHLLNKFFIVRVAWLYGNKRKNFIRNAIENIKTSSEIKVVEDQKGCCTYTKDLSKAIISLINSQLYGIYHITNSEGATRKEILEYIFNILGKRTVIKTVKRKEIFIAERPFDSTLNNFVWKLNNFKPLRSWKEAIKEYLNEFSY